MARLALGLVGAAVGGIIGGPSGAAWGWTLANAAGAYIFPTQLPTVTGPRLEDLSASSSAYTVAIPQLFGTVGIAGNMIWGPPLIETREEDDVGGGKGSTSSQTVVSYTYSCDMAFAFCEGEVDGIKRIWFDSELVWDQGTAVVGSTAKDGVLIRVYTGSETQQPDPLIQSIEGITNTPAYRGICYIVIEGLQLAEYGNRRPNVRAEVVNGGTLGIKSTTIVPDNNWAYTAEDQFPQKSGGNFYYTQRVGTDETQIFDMTTGNLVVEYTEPDSQEYKCWDGQWAYAVDTSSPFAIRAMDPMTGERIGAISVESTAYLTNDLDCDDQYIYVYGAIANALEIWRNDWLRIKNIYGSYVLFRGAGRMFTLTSFHERTYIGAEPDTGYIWILESTAGTPECKLHLVTPSTATVGASVSTVDLRQAFDNLGERDTVGPWNAADNFYLANGYSVYDPATQSIILAHTDDNTGASLSTGFYRLECTTRHDLDTLRIAASNTDRIPSDPTENNPYRTQVLNGDGVYVSSVSDHPGGGFYLYEYNTSDMTEIAFHGNFTTLLGNSTDPGSWFVLGGKGLVVEVNSNEGLRLLQWGRISSDGITLDQVVSAICLRHGLDATDIDVTALATQTVDGYVINGAGPGRAQIDSLMAGYLFDAVETGGQLIFDFKANKSVSTQILEADLDARDGGKAETVDLRLKRFEEVSLPQVVQISFISEALEYEPSAQYSEKPTSPSVNQVKLALPIVMTDAYAKQLAQKWVQAVRAERHNGEITLGPKYLALDPADGATLNRGSFIENIYITRIGLAPNSLQQVVEFTTFDVDAYTSTATAAVPQGYLTSQLSKPPQAAFLQLDAPLLDDFQDQPGFYWAAAPYNDPDDFVATSALRRIQGDTSQPWTTIGSALNAGQAGTALSVLADFTTPNVFDRVNTISVRMWGGVALSSSTELDVLNGANVLFYPTTGELVQFVNATLEVDGSYTLDTLLRGQRGSEWATSEHVANETIVLITSTRIYSYQDSLSNRNTNWDYKAVVGNRPLSETVQSNWLATYERIVPRSPASLKAQTLQTDEIYITWIRRARVNAEWLDDIDVPLDEPTEEYDLEIESAGAIIRAERLVGVTEFSYTSALQTLDGLTPPGTSLTIRVYQISSRVGRGRVAEITN